MSCDQTDAAPCGGLHSRVILFHGLTPEATTYRPLPRAQNTEPVNLVAARKRASGHATDLVTTTNSLVILTNLRRTCPAPWA